MPVGSLLEHVLRVCAQADTLIEAEPDRLRQALESGQSGDSAADGIVEPAPAFLAPPQAEAKRNAQQAA